MTNQTSRSFDPPHSTVLPPDSGFEARWAAWVARGQAHEQRVRRKLVVLASAFALATAILYAFIW